jgi:hypothetical protein
MIALRTVKHQLASCLTSLQCPIKEPTFEHCHHAGRWEARIGIPGSKHIYLGLFNEEREAARMYDAALVNLHIRDLGLCNAQHTHSL